MCDSQSVIQLAKNQVHHERTKHIDVMYHFIREVLEKKEINLIKVAGEDNAIDMFTKAIPISKLHHCLSLLLVLFCEWSGMNAGPKDSKLWKSSSGNTHANGGDLL